MTKLTAAYRRCLRAIAVASVLAGAIPPSFAYADPAPRSVRSDRNEDIVRAFRDALACVSECKGAVAEHGHPPPAKGVPAEFSALLSTPAWKQSFLTMLGEMPPEFIRYGLIQPGEYPGLVMSGSLYYIVNRDGRTAYIYRFVGLPEGVPARRPKGNLDVIVDLEQREMAGIWNGPDDLSQYRFLGSANLLPSLIAYEAAGEAEIERATKISRAERPASVVLPLPADRWDYTRARLDYLASLVANGQINGARSMFYEGEQLRKKNEKPERVWYAIDASRTDCIKSVSPAARINMIRDNGFKEITRDATDSQGNLVKVDISYGDGPYVFTTTYYAAKETCMASLADERAVPDKYR